MTPTLNTCTGGNTAVTPPFEGSVGGVGALLNSQKRAKMKASVLFFDKKTTDSSPNIELLTIAEVAEALKISESTVRRWQQQRLIPFLKIGGSVRFSKSDLEMYLEEKRVASIV
ncbi:MAG TPA: hypothetical protein DIS62_02480 [Candidatus Kerfeldbacteria bacterium]|uniref:Helix-turn-helix domain-containing protein n=1 Tax=Candidatus Kaiserbacteria bacterium GW2011_GWA2_52_12 TaxID=1618671 RepID=A0A0G1ZT02_9BACT|nr:MAG: hypothetical protein UY67_C0038G0003 [Candidatus Kaiserbacteria bacterium GW2011_GWA2_52_12]HCJ52620.1 hypothetical protein [Candidatus Kerfeldbacteria bacterium]HCM67845.1 hypothetical protein [Candidatus Kerfeldbacteria bacterium]